MSRIDDEIASYGELDADSMSRFARLAEIHNEEVNAVNDGAAAKIATLTGDYEKVVADNTRLKAHNYDLLTAVKADESPSEVLEKSGDGPTTTSVEDLFERK